MRHVITIDGPSGSGKSTVAKILSEKLGWSYLDSGALYRIAAWIAEHDAIDESDLPQYLTSVDVSFVYQQGNYSALVGGMDVSSAIRTESIGARASQLAAIPEIRSSLLNMQRNFKSDSSLVTDGRDMGTVIFPNADLKIFLTAHDTVRARRRCNELQAKGLSADYETVLEQLRQRDLRDSQRSNAPLYAASDCILIDSSQQQIPVIVAKLLNLWHNN